jgi:hypothetical protein
MTSNIMMIAIYFLCEWLPILVIYIHHWQDFSHHLEIHNITENKRLNLLPSPPGQRNISLESKDTIERTTGCPDPEPSKSRITNNTNNSSSSESGKSESDLSAVKTLD